MPVYTKGLISKKEKYQGQYQKRCFFQEQKDQRKALEEVGCAGTEEGEFEIMILKKPEQKGKWKAKEKTNCYLCEKPLLQKNYRDAVKDHCHLTGNYQGAAHNACNLKLRINPKTDQIPVVFHNLRGYDAHHLMQEMANLQKEVKCVANNMEKYITISVDGLRFIDSLNFLQGSLDSLVKATPKEALKITSTLSNGCDLLYKKGIYPYEYMDSFEKFSETSLPKKEDFYSKLNDEHITEDEYVHAKTVWRLSNAKHWETTTTFM